jgi:hypothetical protein
LTKFSLIAERRVDPDRPPQYCRSVALEEAWLLPERASYNARRRCPRGRGRRCGGRVRHRGDGGRAGRVRRPVTSSTTGAPSRAASASCGRHTWSTISVKTFLRAGLLVPLGRIDIGYAGHEVSRWSSRVCSTKPMNGCRRGAEVPRRPNILGTALPMAAAVADSHSTIQHGSSRQDTRTMLRRQTTDLLTAPAHRSMARSSWAAIGAAIAVTFGQTRPETHQLLPPCSSLSLRAG